MGTPGWKPRAADQAWTCWKSALGRTAWSTTGCVLPRVAGRSVWVPSVGQTLLVAT